MLIEVPGDSLIQELRKPVKDGFDDTRREKRSYSCLRAHKNVGKVKRGTHLVIAQLVLDLVLSQKRI